MKTCSVCGDAGHNKRTCPTKKVKIAPTTVSSVEGYKIGDVCYFKSYGMKQVHQGEIIAIYLDEPESCVGVCDLVDESTRVVPVALLALKKADASNKSTEYFLTTNNN
jgi:hypothetical protein